MASFTLHLKENLKKSFTWLKDLNKRDLFRKSELSTLPRLAAAAGILVGLVGFALVPFPMVAYAVTATTVAGFAYGATRQPKKMLEYTALGSVAVFAAPGALTGGIVAAAQFGVMLGVKSVIDVFKAFKSASKDRAAEKAAKAPAETPAVVPAPAAEKPAVAVTPAATPAFTAAAHENKPAIVTPAAPAATPVAAKPSQA